MTTTAPKVPKRAYRTYAYTSFKREFSLLSRLHWYFDYATSSAVGSVLRADPSGTQTVTQAHPAPPMDGTRLAILSGEFVNARDDTMAHLRAVLLVKGCASLEDYIHRHCEYYAVFKGYVGQRPNTLSPVGDALIAPGLKSSLRTSLTYISSLMGHDFGGVLAVVVEAYQIRCAVAHNGGVVDSEAARRLPKLAKNLGKRILLFWKELLVYLDGIDKIAQQIDLTIPERPLSRTEARWLIQDSIDGNKKISAHEIRHRLANSHGLKSMPSAREISAEFGVPEGAKIVAK